MLEFSNVSKSYGSVLALDPISFKIDKGEFVFLVGPSGAGKTTILKLIIADTRPTTGKILFEGVDIGKIKKQDIPFLRQRVGVVFQDFKLLQERTVRENIEVALAVKNVDQKSWRDKTNQVLKTVGLLQRSELFPAQLSGGELQRVSIARALVVDPILIFADEPTGNLDWETAKGIMDLFLEINKQGKTVIVTSHNRAIIKRANKRVIDLALQPVSKK